MDIFETSVRERLSSLSERERERFVQTRYKSNAWAFETSPAHEGRERRTGPRPRERREGEREREGKEA